MIRFILLQPVSPSQKTATVARGFAGAVFAESTDGVFAKNLS